MVLFLFLRTYKNVQCTIIVNYCKFVYTLLYSNSSSMLIVHYLEGDFPLKQIKMKHIIVEMEAVDKASISSTK